MRLRYNLCLCITAIVAAGLLCNRPSAAQGLSAPPAIQANVERALALVSVRYQNHSRRETDQAGQDLEQLLDQVGTQVSPALSRQAAATEGDSILAKMVLIAWDRQQRPQFYQEIDREYIHKVRNLHERALRSPVVSQQHWTETYRLPWEFFLLRPPSPTIAPRALDNAYVSIAHTGNNNSLVTLVYIFQQTTHPDVELIDDFIQRQQRAILGTILEFRTPQGVEALLTCVALSDAQQAELARHKAGATPEQLRPFSNQFGWETHRELAESLAEALAQKQKGSGWWQRALAAYPATGLTAGQKDLVEKVKSAKVGQANP